MTEASQKLADLERITRQLREALEVPDAERTTRDRDSAILRFELAVHVYHEPLAEALHKRLPGYLEAFESLLGDMRKLN